MKQQNKIPKGAKPYKVILVGSQAVGKSTLLHRIIESKFDPNYTTTIGVDFKTIVVSLGLKQVVLQIWDTAGQQKFRALTRSYFRGVQGCICVYDINEPDTLARAQDYLKQALEFKIDPECIFLLANKSDQCEDKSAEQAGKTVADEHDVNFLRVSAKEGEGLSDLVNNLATKIDLASSNNADLDVTSDIHLRPVIKIEENQGRRCAC